ncbi:hypothetical protein KUV95_17135 [Microbulbifer agarilyticus]|uniref:hypothetical protein n=1 Tax=Microbulbifer agarilyticus TaxID=260552 RepID=UPI001C938604|nr:hypothetical protein [Microbulbifer agarilyticus]MBY6190621.1 hypothetical protein [Microbulbifer agarilyticus]MBY6213275.1 hypothetical protein [Microbulbifer agarilyticus]
MERRVKVTIGALAVLLSIVAYYFGAAVFTPAVLLSLVSAPLAVFSLFNGVWRLGFLALYFSIGAVVISPAIGLSAQVSDSLFVITSCVGLIISVVLWVSWRRSNKVT